MTARGRWWFATAVAVSMLLSVPACSDDAEVAELRVVTGGPGGDEEEYRFELPDEVDAGPVRFTLSNEGDEAHHAQIFQLDDGATTADLEAALATGDPAAALEVGSFLGGTGLVSPGEESRADAIVDLEPGDYALLCFVSGADGVPHLAHGMVHRFAVGNAASPPAPTPDADVAVELVDYRFELPDRLDGDATLAITNASATEAHEMVIARLDGDASIRDVVDALDDHAPLPAVALGGMQAILPGTTQHLQLDLDPGRYVVLCAVTSPDGTPHFHAGMIEEVTVT